MNLSIHSKPLKEQKMLSKIPCIACMVALRLELSIEHIMFYCMSALLATQGVYAKTHQGIRAKFSELFIKNSLFPSIIAKYIGNAFDLRQEADYDLNANITEDEAKILVENAREFYNLTKNHLEKLL